MIKLLYAIVAILIIAWGVGFFLLAASGLIHILLVIAFLVILLRFLIPGNKP
ncbi:MAG TPA: lmo0937 family membrane protein [Chitinophagaceae bacterium]|nr:lmo0937 family membrane protein [Chitinophagaceae bacterium]